MPDQQIPDVWQLDSGLREDMVIQIHSAYFAPHADYQDGKVLLLWLLGVDENDEPVEIRNSVGGDWQTDDGNVIVHPTKRKQHINKNSIYGHWISHCFEIPELAKVLIDRAQTGIGPTDARIWLDLVLHLQIREIKFGRNIDPQERLMPTEYLGLVQDLPTSTPAPAPQVEAPSAAPAIDPQAAIAAARAAKQQGAAVTNGSPLYMRAVELAKAAADFPTFLAQALADDDILADDELAERCADESQIWASVH